MDADITFSLLSYSDSTKKKSLKTKPPIERFVKLSSSKKQSKSTHKNENVGLNPNVVSRRCLAKTLIISNDENLNGPALRILKERNSANDSSNFIDQNSSNKDKENTSYNRNNLPDAENKIATNPPLAASECLKFSSYQEIIDNSKKLFQKKKDNERRKDCLSKFGMRSSLSDKILSSKTKIPIIKDSNVASDVKKPQNFSNSSKGTSSLCSENPSPSNSQEGKKNDSFSTSYSSLDHSKHKGKSISKNSPSSVISILSSPDENKSLYESLPSILSEKICYNKRHKLISSTPRCSRIFNTSHSVSPGFESAALTLSKDHAHVSKCSVSTSLTKISEKVRLSSISKDPESSKGKQCKDVQNSSEKIFEALLNSDSSGKKTYFESSGENQSSRRYNKSDEGRVVFDTLKLKGVTIRRHRREKVLGLQKDFMYDETSSASSDEESNIENHCLTDEPEIGSKPVYNKEQELDVELHVKSYSDDSLSPIIRKLKSKPLLESSKSCSDNSSMFQKSSSDNRESQKSIQNNSSSSFNESKSDSVIAAEKLLDELYGTTWHDKKESILPKSSIKKVRKKEIPTNVVQQNIQFTSDEENTPGKNLVKKKLVKKKKDSFIKDSSSESDSNDLNFYRSFTNNVQLRNIKPRAKSHATILISSSEESLNFGENKSLSPFDSKNLNLSLKSNNRTDLSTKRSKAKAPSLVTKKNIKVPTLNDKKSPIKKSVKTLSPKKLDPQISSSSSDESSIKISKKSILKKDVKPIINTPFKPSLKKLKINSPAKFSGKESQKISFLASLSATADESRLHPDAVPYKKNYKAKKEELAKRLLILYNKEVFENKLPDDMLIQWNARMRSTSGFCYNKKVRRTGIEMARVSRIVLSTKILDTPDRLRDTLIHELCHSAAWIVHGAADGHGPIWKSWASKAMRRFPELPPIKRCHDYSIKTKFTYRCTSCGYSIGRHSKSLDLTRKRCGYCYGAFELLVNHSKSNRKSAENLKAPRTPGKFALFVKENYNIVKQSNTQLKNPEIMKILGQKFAAIKNQASNK